MMLSDELSEQPISQQPISQKKPRMNGRKRTRLRNKMKKMEQASMVKEDARSAACAAAAMAKEVEGEFEGKHTSQDGDALRKAAITQVQHSRELLEGSRAHIERSRAQNKPRMSKKKRTRYRNKMNEALSANVYLQ